MGCSNLEERIEDRGIVNDLKDDLASGLVQMSCSPVKTFVTVYLTSAWVGAYPLICENHRADCLELLQPVSHSRGCDWDSEVAFDVINSLNKAFPLQEQGSGIYNRHPVKRHEVEVSSEESAPGMLFEGTALLSQKGYSVEVLIFERSTNAKAT